MKLIRLQRKSTRNNDFISDCERICGSDISLLKTLVAEILDFCSLRQQIWQVHLYNRPNLKSPDPLPK